MLLTAKWHFRVLLLLCIILLIVPVMLRENFDRGMPIGEESYNILRYSEYLSENQQLPQEDPYSYGSRSFLNEIGYPIILLLNVNTLRFIFPFIFGIFSFVFFYLIIKKIKPEVASIASLLFIVSPSFLYLFSTNSKHGPALMLILIGLYSYLTKNKKISIISFGLSAFFSFFLSLIPLILMFFYEFRNKNLRSFLYLLVIDFVAFMLQFKSILFSGLPDTIFGIKDFSLASIFTVLFSDFGSKFGISLFLFLLAIFGIYYKWHDKLRYVLIYLILLILLIASFYLPQLLFVLFTSLAILAAYGLFGIISYEWKSDILKKITILIVLCGLLFSSLSYISRIPEFTPTGDFIEGLNYLEGLEEGIVFSHYSRGTYISYAKKPNFMDTKFTYAPDFNQRYEDSERILHGKNIKETVALINRYNIKYFWIDKELREKLWGKNDIELLFLLKYSPENFEKIFDNGDVEIYEYIGYERGTKAGLR